MSDDTLYVGLDLNGAEDICAHFRKDPKTETSWRRGCCPPTVILPRQRGERPLAGVAAAEAIEGRGWPWPEVARAKSLEDSLRVPVIELLARLEIQNAASWQGPSGSANFSVGDLVGAHAQACLPSGVRRCVVLAPDSLSELGQQRLLDGLRKVVPEPELLWRPIGVLLGWAEGKGREALHNLHGTDAVVVHLGFVGVEVSRVGLEIEDSEVGPLLVPVRRCRGQRCLPLAPCRLPTWVGSRALEDVAALEARLLGGGEAMQWQLQWVSSRIWDVTLGRLPQETVLQDENGDWLLVSENVSGSVAFEEIAGEVARALGPLLTASFDVRAPAGLIIIEGALSRCPVGPETLGEVVCRLVAEQTIGWRKRAAPVILDTGYAATGAAIHSWRLQRRLPTYYDVLPQLEINAIKELRAEFIPLVARAGKVRGGREYGPRTIPGFSIGAGTSKVKYYLAKDDEPTVRLTETLIPEAPRETTAVDLVVSLKPGQGFAAVEIRPGVRGSLGGRAVYLDWSTMEDTGKTRAEVLGELGAEYGLAYPDLTPLRAHASVWSSLFLAPKIERFLRQRLVRTTEYFDAAVSLRQSLGQRVRVGGEKCGPITSAGKLPPALDAARLRLADHTSVKDLFASLIRKIDGDFAVLRRRRSLADVETKIHRQLFLIASWCYTEAPPSVMDYLRAVLLRKEVINVRFGVNAVGRTFSKESDLRLFFEWCTGSFLRGLRAPLKRTKALVEILQYRERAPWALTVDQAYTFAQVARSVMDEQVKARAIKTKFFTAAWLLVALLRFRLIDPTFLDPGHQTHGGIVRAVQKILGRARDLLPRGPQGENVAGLLRQIELYLERRGTNALIFKELEARAEGEGDDDDVG